MSDEECRVLENSVLVRDKILAPEGHGGNANPVSGGASKSTNLTQETVVEISKDIEHEMEVGNAFNVANGVQIESRATEGTYASRAARTSGPKKETVVSTIDLDNKLPGRPCTAFFTPNLTASPKSVFEALDNGDISDKDVLCLHRRQGGEIQTTFRTEVLKEKFLRLNSITIDNENFALQDVDKPLTFLSVYDTPYELLDLAIMKRLQPYCEAIHSRRGRYSL